MKRFFPLFTALAFLLPTPSRAAKEADPGEFSFSRTMPLNEAQRKSLQNLVETDPEASLLFSELKAEAKPFLTMPPRPLEEIHYEGLVNTDPARIATVEKLRDMVGAALLVKYWQASDDPTAAETLRKIILAWAKTYRPTGNDVNENKLSPLFTAYEALRPTFPEAEREIIDSWLKQITRLHLDAARKAGKKTNRYTKTIRIIAIAGRIFDEKEWTEFAVQGLKNFVTDSLRPDGTSYDLERRDTLTYHASGLRPLVALAIISSNNVENLYEWESANGSSIKKSVDYLVPYANGSKTRKEWLNTTIDLDRRRAAAGLEKYRQGRLYEPTDAIRLLEESSYFDPTLIPLVLKLSQSSNKKFANWTSVVNAVAR